MTTAPDTGSPPPDRRPAMTTADIADVMNEALESDVYDVQAIRAEIDSGRLRAIIGARRARRRIRVTEDEFLRWAAIVLHDDELARLRKRLKPAVS